MIETHAASAYSYPLLIKQLLHTPLAQATRTGHEYHRGWHYTANLAGIVSRTRYDLLVRIIQFGNRV